MPVAGARADRITALVLFGLGLAMLIGGYTMDRLEIRQIHPASIPGLLPMILGGTLMVCAILLFGFATDTPADGSPRETEAGAVTAGDNWRALVFTAAYSVVYALVLVGRMPFVLATAIYIAVFTIHFAIDWSGDMRSRIVSLAGVIVFAILCAAAVSALFQYAFLVRLP